jgi:arabinogalactan endo-1,4-beta-galactosidase
MKMKYLSMIVAMAGTLQVMTACDQRIQADPPAPPVYDMTGFAKGADVSWLTEMEKAGRKFYDHTSKETDCLELLRSLGVNAIRLRVWVHPATGWCTTSEMIAKAIRANNLGMRLMIDFHYSDTWADPGQQTIPTQWSGMNLNELQEAVRQHTTSTLEALQSHGITPEWVQAGNETSNGMLWPVGKADDNMENYAALNNAGYDAVKSVSPTTKVIVHLHNGYDNNLYRYLFDALKNHGGKWDAIGMSLYPSITNWKERNNSCIANINDLVSRYNTEVVICEVGMPWDQLIDAYAFLTDLISQATNNTGGRCTGVFYWEPQAYGNWKDYSMGAFDDTGKPTVAMDAFK